jgi:hypothetical protein
MVRVCKRLAVKRDTICGLPERQHDRLMELAMLNTLEENFQQAILNTLNHLCYKDNQPTHVKIANAGGTLAKINTLNLQCTYFDQRHDRS